MKTRRHSFRGTFKLSDGTTSTAYGCSRLGATRVLRKRVSRRILIVSVQRWNR